MREYDTSSLMTSKQQINSLNEKWETILSGLSRLRLVEERLKESITERQAEVAGIKLNDSMRNLKIKDTVEIANKYQEIFKAKQETIVTVVAFHWGRQIFYYIYRLKSRCFQSNKKCKTRDQLERKHKTWWDLPHLTMLLGVE